jgi:hypothetical protein
MRHARIGRPPGDPETVVIIGSGLFIWWQGKGSAKPALHIPLGRDPMG